MLTQRGAIAWKLIGRELVNRKIEIDPRREGKKNERRRKRSRNESRLGTDSRENERATGETIGGRDNFLWV